MKDSQECEAPGCERAAVTKALCGLHYKRMRKNGSFGELPSAKPKVCTVDGCDTVVRCVGLCGRHYQRQRTLGTTEYFLTKCELCPAMFQKSGLQKWCEDCQLKGSREYTRLWRERNAQHILDYSKQYAIDNPDVRRAYMDANRATVRQWTQRRRARLKENGVFVVTAKDLDRLFRAQCFQCAYCPVQLDYSTVTWDHIIPISRGGVHSVGNLTPACKPCNSGKRDKMPIEWRMFLSKTGRVPRLAA